MRSGICQIALKEMGNTAAYITCPMLGHSFIAVRICNSVVLLAVTDANAYFTMIKAGDYRKI